jgi:Trk K+ transport system NAD-binding subunit
MPAGTATGPSVRERIRYRYDSLLSRGTVGVIIWLFAITLLVILAGGVLFRLVLDPAFFEKAGFFEGLWRTSLLVFGKGSLPDGTWPFRLFTALFIAIGIFLAAALIGVLSTAFNRRLTELRKGRSTVLESGHVLILGWSPRLFSVIKELAVASAGEARPRVVILAPEDKTEMEDELDARLGKLGKLKLVCRTGDPSNPDDLAMVRAGAARSVIVLSASAWSDGDTVKAVLALMHDDPQLRRFHVVVELTDARYGRALAQATNGRVLTVRADDVIARVTGQACRQPGLSHVYLELLDFAGDEIHLRAVPQLDGLTFGEALLAFEHAAVIGRVTAADEVQLLPPMDTRFTTGDQVVAIAADDTSIRFTGGPPITAPATAEGNGEVRAAEHLLVVGWSATGELTLRELDRFLPAGSRVEIRVDEALVDPEAVPVPILRNTHVTFVGEADEPDLVDRVSDARFDEVLVLGYREGVSESDADARTLLTLLTLDRARDAGTVHVPRVIAQLLDAKHLPLARIAGADDFIVSDSLASRMIGQLSSRPELGTIFDGLFDPEGAYLAVELASSYLPAGSYPFAEVVSAARARGQAAIGYRQPDGRVRLNPPKSEPLSVSDDVRVVIVKTREDTPRESERISPTEVTAGVEPGNGGGSLIGRVRSAIGALLP